MNVDGDADFEAEVPAHSRDSLPSGSVVRINIFQSGEVRLIDFVEEVLTGKGEFDAVVSEDVQVHACRQVEEGIAGRRCFGVIDGIELVLPQVVFHPEGKESALAVTLCEVGKFVANVARPLRSRHHGQILCFFWLVKLHASNIAESIFKV